MKTLKNIKSIILAFIILSGISATAQNTYTVTNTNDPDPFLFSINPNDSTIVGSLQWAFRKANDDTNPCVIDFNISGTGVHEILLEHELPMLTNDVTIDASTQSGYLQNSPTIKVNGQGNIGSFLQTYNCEVNIIGLFITDFRLHGILLNNSYNSEVRECTVVNIDNGASNDATTAIRMLNSETISLFSNLIGTDLVNTGLFVEDYGIFVQSSNNCIIGDADSGKGNTIANCNARGIWLAWANNNRISGNLIFDNPIGIQLSVGSNNEKPAPFIETYNIIDGQISGTSDPNDIIELFGSTGNHNANIFLATTITDASGNWSANLSTNTYDYCIATATDENNNTSGLTNAMLPQIPTTQLMAEDCNISDVEFNQELSAEEVAGAEAYLFTIENTNTNSVETISSIDNYFSLSEVSNVDYNTIFNISAQIYFEGQTGEISESCSVTTVNEPTEEFVSGKIWVKEKIPYEEAINTFNLETDVLYSSMTGFGGLAINCGITKIEKTFKIIGPNSDLLRNIYTISFENDSLTDTLLTFLTNHFQIEFAEKIPDVEFFADPSDYSLGTQYYLDIINAQGAWGIQSPGSKHVTIAITDDAIRIDHQDLAANIWVNQGELPEAIADDGDGYISISELFFHYFPTESELNVNLLFSVSELFNGDDDDENGYADDIIGYDVAENDNNVNPPFFDNSVFTHGTHVSGIAGAVCDNGSIASLSYNCSIIPIKCSPDELVDEDGDGIIDEVEFNIEYAIAGIEYAIACNANIINMSWGTHTNSSVLQNIIQEAFNEGAILVAGAGNKGNDPDLCIVPYYPAGYESVVCVAASNNLDVKANISNFSDIGEDYISVVAPGQTIYNCKAGSVNSYGNMTGTSMATPLVSSLCALMKSHCPSCSREEIVNCIVSTCDPMSSEPLFSTGQLGAGRINAYEALICLDGLEPVAGFSHEFDLICPGLNVQFFDESTGMPAETWYWTVSAPGIIDDPNAQDPIITFPDEGDYSVSLSVLPGTTTNYYEEVVHVDNPTVSIITESGEVCTDQSIFVLIILEGTPPFELGYSVGDGVNTPDEFTITIEDNTHILVIPSNPTQTIISLTDLSCEPGCIGAIDEIVTFNTIDCGCIPLTNNHWQFGNNWGIDFTGIPSFYESPMEDARENNACISDADGNFLFSTNGEVIYDRSENLMLGGEDLIGCKSATQNSLILPNPAYNGQYYVFVNSALDCPDPLAGTMCYVVDMNENGNGILLGEVINQIDYYEGEEDIGEKLTWIKHSNGHDFWVIIHANNGNRFYVYQVTEDGITANPNNPITVGIESPGNDIGVLKGSLNSELLVYTCNFGFQIFEFDNSTGMIFENSNYPFIDFSHAYAAEFSPNAQFLYVSTWGGIINQYEVNNLENPIILNSSATSLQYWTNGFNERILYSHGLHNIGSIETPNDFNPVLEDNFMVNNDFDNQIGLPHINPFDPVHATINNIVNVCNETDCNGELTLQVSGGFPPYEIIWDDSENQTELTATGLCTGDYTAIVSDQQGCQITVSATIESANLDLSYDFSEPCEGAIGGGIDLSVTGGEEPYSFLWVTGSTQEDITGIESGLYTVTVTDAGGCILIGEPYLEDLPGIFYSENVINETCPGIADGSIEIIVTSGLEPITFLWEDGSTANSIENLSTGTYYVTIENGNGCTIIQDFQVLLLNEVSDVIASFDSEGMCLVIGEPVSFNNTSTPNDAVFYWEYSEGESTSQTGDLVFGEYGYYCVTLTASNACSENSVTESVFIYPGTCACHNGFLYDYPMNSEGVSLEVSASDNWVGVHYLIEGDLIIVNGVTLTLKSSTLRFGPKGRIIVREGDNITGNQTNLIIESSTLTTLENCDNYMWYGIEVHGIPTYPSSSFYQGKVYVSGDFPVIENAHIAILSGARNDDYPCGGLNYIQPLSPSSSGGIVVLEGTNNHEILFNNNGIDIKFMPKLSPFEGSQNKINYCVLNGLNLHDPMYDSDYPNHYPNEHNPWVIASNKSGRSNAGIYIDRLDKLTINNCDFLYKEFCIESYDSRYIVDKSNFYEARFGIYINNTSSPINTGHLISNCTFDFIPGTMSPGLGIAPAAIHLEASFFDEIKGNRIGSIFTGQNNNYCGINSINSNSFKIHANEINRHRTGFRIHNSNTDGGFIGAASPLWYPNIFTSCKTNTYTNLNNSKLKLRCNNCNNYEPVVYLVNFRNNGSLANQGQAAPGYPAINGSRYGAGNEFQPDYSLTARKVQSNSYFRYYHHNQIKTIPFQGLVTSSSGISILPTWHDKLLNSISCKEVFTLVPNIPDIGFVDVLSQLNSLSVEIAGLNDQLALFEADLDNGKTEELLDDINGNLSGGKLKNKLIENSPLSDEVINELIVVDPLSPGNFKNVMENNLPVTNELMPIFSEKLDNLPTGIANQLFSLQGSNPGIITRATFVEEIDLKTKDRQLFLNDAIIYLTDTINNNDSLAIVLLESEGTLNADKKLISTYLRNGNLLLAATKLNSLYYEDEATGDWVLLTQILLNLKNQEKTLYDLSDVEIDFIRTLAYKCPEEIATSNAKAILMKLFREEIGDCPEEIATRKLQINQPVVVTNGSVAFLGDNYPDPARESTKIEYFIPEGEGKMVISDAFGRELENFPLLEGKNYIEIRLDKYNSGMYFYKMLIGKEVIGRKKLNVIK